MSVRVQALGQAGNHSVIVLFPHAGGSPRTYRSLSGLLPAGIDLYGVTYPGRDQLLDEPAPETLVDLASQCATELESLVRSSGSVVLFGHSMGAYLALEVTRLLESAGIPVTALVLSGADAPHLEQAAGAERAWHCASDDELAGHISELDVRGREALAVPELRDMFLPIIRDDYRLVENYRSAPAPQLTCPLHILHGESDPEVRLDDSAEWAGYTQAVLRIRTFPGGHFYLTSHAAEVVAYLADIFK